jgi:hypothetical protein
MIKEAHPVAMQLFGYAVNETAISDAKIAPTSKMLTIGENCDIHYTVTICPEQTTQLRLEYGIDFIKANGKTSRKKFLLSDKTLVGKTILAGTRTHKWANLTTRRHYPGKHAIVLLVNGIEVAWTEIELH